MSVASASFPEQRCRLIVQRLLSVLLLALLVIVSVFLPQLRHQMWRAFYSPRLCS